MFWVGISVLGGYKCVLDVCKCVLGRYKCVLGGYKCVLDVCKCVLGGYVCFSGVWVFLNVCKCVFSVFCGCIVGGI